VTVNTFLRVLEYWSIIMRELVLLCINQVYSFINYKDMIGAKLQKQVTWLWPRPF